MNRIKKWIIIFKTIKWKQFKWHFYSKNKKQKLREMVKKESEAWDSI